MEIGIFSQPETVDKAVEHASLFADAGFGSYWMPQIFGLDTLTALTVVHMVLLKKFFAHDTTVGVVTAVVTD
jgi:hypothetical protein